MKQGNRIALTLVVGLALAGAVLAAEAQKAEWVHGTITAVDLKARTVTINDGRESVSVTLAENASLLSGSQAIQFSSLTKGEHVKVEYTMANGSRLGSKLELMKSEGAKPGTTSKPSGTGTQPMKRR